MFTRHLPHDVPLWIDPTRELYFVTINCEPRHHNHLAQPKLADELFDTVKFRQESGLWFVHLLLLMPDHLHFLVSVGNPEEHLVRVIGDWKKWTARRLQIPWQKNFFEHRLRAEESRPEKADYILQNPVRAGLVGRAEDWPYVWIPNPAPHEKPSA